MAGPDAIHLYGLAVDRPSASTSNEGIYYTASDTAGGTTYRSNGTTWDVIAAGASAGFADHNHTAAGGDGGTLTNDAHDGYMEMAEIAAPATPAANKLRIYPKDKAGEAVLYYKSDAGTEYELPTLGTGGGGTGAPNFDDGATPAALAAAAATGDDTSPSRRDHVHLDPVVAHAAAADPHPVYSRAWKTSVRVASTVTRALATEVENGDTIDGVVLATGDRVLLKDQSAPADNGIYTVNASGAPTRGIDADAAAEVRQMVVAVEEGTAGAETIWLCTTNAPITLGTTGLVFVKIYPQAAPSTALDDLTDVVITGLASGEILKFNGTNWVNDTDEVGSGGGGDLGDYVLLQDRKASSTASGTFTSGAWRTRVLNTEVEDTGNHCSLASNQFDLAAGTWRIRAIGMVYAVARHHLRLQNITDTTTPITGMSEYDNTDDSGAASLVGRFTIAATKTFELQHRCETTGQFGIQSGSLFTVDTEIFAQVELWKE